MQDLSVVRRSASAILLPQGWRGLHQALRQASTFAVAAAATFAVATASTFAVAAAATFAVAAADPRPSSATIAFALPSRDS